jgi:predicted AAA+ superfamily ATPase
MSDIIPNPMKDLVKRETYLRKIRPFIGTPLIKIITGIRRCGKSSMFSQIIDELSDSGVKKENIIRLSLDDISNAALWDPIKFYEHVVDTASGSGMYYVFLDEIQNVSEWERVANSLLQKDNMDIYLSGSNSKLFSSELATFIAGRYVSIEMHTLSFKEFGEFKRRFTPYSGDGKDLLKEYIRKGGFPLTSISDFSTTASDNIVKDTYESIFFRDTVKRNKIRDTQQLELFIRFMFDNIGNPFSASNISREFENNGIRLDVHRIIQFLDYLERSYLIRRVRRYDLREKRIVGSEDKYYVSDVSLIYALIGYKKTMISAIEENIVYLELLRRDYSVTVGRAPNNGEVDFVAEKGGKKIYVQVTNTISRGETEEREFSSLESINDNYPKYVVIAEDMWPLDHKGIIHMGLADFLLSDAY